jgi:hypothetical protein
MAAPEEYYSSVKDVIDTTGIQAQDLGFPTDDLMKDWIGARLIEIKDMIDRDRNRDFAAEAAEKGTDIPPGIHGIALRMMSNLVGAATLRRTTPIIRVDDFTIKGLEDQVFTEPIRKDLRRFPAKLDGIIRRLGFVVMTKNGAAAEEEE